MSYTRTLYEAVKADGDAEANVLASQNLAAGNTDTAWVTIAGYRQCEFLVNLGALNDALATVDVSVRQATTNVGAGAKALAGRRGAKVAAQIIAGAGFATGNRLLRINVRAEEMDVNNAFAFLSCRITVSAGDTCQAAVSALRAVPEYKPVTDDNVTEIVD